MDGVGADALGEVQAEPGENLGLLGIGAANALYEHVAARVEEGESADEPAEETWEAVRALAFAAAGRPLPDEAMPAAFRPEPPRLTEHWFC